MPALQTLKPVPAKRLPAHVRRFQLQRPPAGHQDLRHLDMPTLRPAAGKLGLLEPIPRPKRGKAGTRLEAWGEVIVKNGATEFRARNKIVGQGLRHLVNSGFLGGQNAGGGTSNDPFATNDLTRSYIRVGTGSGSTIDTTTALVAQVATSPSSTAASFDNPSSGVYRNKFTATWNAGAITGATVQEIGIFGNLLLTLGTSRPSSANSGYSALSLFARLSASDAEFTAFTINTAVPLTIEYRVVFTFT